MGYGTRQPTSNEPPAMGNPYLDDRIDEFALILNGLGKRCKGSCGRAIPNKLLTAEGLCPDCAAKAVSTEPTT